MGFLSSIWEFTALHEHFPILTTDKKKTTNCADFELYQGIHGSTPQPLSVKDQKKKEKPEKKGEKPGKQQENDRNS